jgi:uncharacterized protein
MADDTNEIQSDDEVQTTNVQLTDFLDTSDSSDTESTVAQDEREGVETQENGREKITPAEIGEYLTHDECARYFGFKIDDVDHSAHYNRNAFTEAFRPLNPLLAKAGDDFEQTIEATLGPAARAVYRLGGEDSGTDVPPHRQHEFNVFDRTDVPWQDLETMETAKESDMDVVRAICELGARTPFDESLQEPPEDTRPPTVTTTSLDAPDQVGRPWVLLQPRLATDIGWWFVPGKADFLVIWPTSDGILLRVFDIKSAAHEKTYHRIQTACYALALRDLLTKVRLSDQEGGGRESSTLADVATVQTGVITREYETDSLHPLGLPYFNDQYYTHEVTRLCSADGPLRTHRKSDFENLEYTLEKKCATCPYNEACAVDAAETASLRLLGLDPGERETLAEHDIESLDDLAALVYAPTDDPRSASEGWRPANYDAPDMVKRRETYRTLTEDPALGPQFPELVYRAQSMLGALGSSAVHAHGGDAPWLPRSGWGSLPDDDPAPGYEVDNKRGSLVRVYLNIQQDHLRDTVIQVSGYISASEADCDPVQFAELARATADGSDEISQAEHDLLDTVATAIFDGIEKTAAALTPEDSLAPNPLVHFYTFDSSELNALDESLQRHDSPAIDAFQSLWGCRAGADQPMRSAVRPDAQQRLALKTPTPGLLHLYDQVSTPHEDIKSKNTKAWSYSPDREDAPDTVSLVDAFGFRLFNRRLGSGTPDETVTDHRGEPVETDGPPLAVAGGETAMSGGFGVRVRYGAQIPLGYLLSANDQIDHEWVAELKRDYEDDDYEIEKFRFHDGGHQDYSIHREDVETLGEHLAHALAHIERGLVFKSAEVFDAKASIDLETLREATYETPSLAEACQDYLAMEYDTQREEVRRHYRLPTTQRLITGTTIPVVVTDIRDAPGDFGAAQIEGELAYDHGTFDLKQPEVVKRALRHRGADEQSTGGGDWLVAHRVEEGRTTPDAIEEAPAVILDELAVSDGNGADRITVTLTYEQHDSRFTAEHSTPQTTLGDDSYDEQTVREDDLILLDPRTDQITMDRYHEALDAADANDLHALLEDLRIGTCQRPTTSLFDEARLEEWADWLAENYDADSYPTAQQRACITAGEDQTVAVQGPPGTGKTGGTLAPALLGRCIAAERGTEAWPPGAGLNGLASGPSNKAIDELLRAVIELFEAVDESATLNITDDIELYRIASDVPPDIEASEYVTLYDYNTRSTEERDDLRAALGVADGDSSRIDQIDISSFTEEDDGAGVHTLVFATPSRVWKLMNDVLGNDQTASLFHCMVVDEASMLPLPDFLTAGTNLRADGQLLVGGDQRQLPPVQGTDFSDEYRRSIRELTPYLSTLEYLRALQGDFEMLDADATDDTAIAGTASFAQVGLDETFRFGPQTAAFLRTHIYEDDGIAYSAATPPDDTAVASSASDFVREVLSVNELTVITYDEQQALNQMSNDEEAALITRVAEAVANGDVGVVTPHNAQRGRVETRLQSDLDSETAPLVDTVERFQGDEVPVMAFSATVSDPSFIDHESEFLLNLNRLNVSLSRHTEQTVILAAESLFEYIPDDVETYDDARLWKALGIETGVTDPNREPDWCDTPSLDGVPFPVAVYHFQPE